MNYEKGGDLSPITQAQVDWAEKLASDFKMTSEILTSIAKKAKELDFFTENMRTEIKVQSEAVKYAIVQRKKYYEEKSAGTYPREAK